MPGSYPTTADSTTKKGFSPISIVPWASSTLLQRALPRGGGRWIFLLALGLQADLAMGREFGSHGLPYIFTE